MIPFCNSLRFRSELEQNNFIRHKSYSFVVEFLWPLSMQPTERVCSQIKWQSVVIKGTTAHRHLCLFLYRFGHCYFGAYTLNFEMHTKWFLHYLLALGVQFGCIRAFDEHLVAMRKRLLRDASRHSVSVGCRLHQVRLDLVFTCAECRCNTYHQRPHARISKKNSTYFFFSFLHRVEFH